MARVVQQNAMVHATFQGKMEAKDAAKWERISLRINREIPAWIRPLFRPLARLVWRTEQNGYHNQGDRGESQVARALRASLNDAWTICSDVVIHPTNDIIAQIDHVVIGPPGIYLIETKTWHGTFLAKGDQWLHHQAGRWSNMKESPTRQNAGHVTKFQTWLDNQGLSALRDYVVPAVVVLESKWLRSSDSPMPIFDRTDVLIQWLEEQTRAGEQLKALLRDYVVQKLVSTT